MKSNLCEEKNNFFLWGPLAQSTLIPGYILKYTFSKVVCSATVSLLYWPEAIVRPAKYCVEWACTCFWAPFSLWFCDPVTCTSRCPQQAPIERKTVKVKKEREATRNLGHNTQKKTCVLCIVHIQNKIMVLTRFLMYIIYK